MLLMASTRRSLSWERVISAMERRGLVTPVEVSLWVTRTALMVRSSAEVFVHVVGVDGLAVGGFQLDYVGAEGLGDLDVALSERADGQGKDPVPGRKGVDYGCLHGAGAGARHNVQVVLGLEELLEADGNALQDVLECRAAVVDHLRGHGVEDFVGDGGGAGDSEVDFLVWHGFFSVRF